MQHFKISTSRDFRINAASLQEAMERAAADDESDAAADGANSDDEQVLLALVNWPLVCWLGGLVVRCWTYSQEVVGLTLGWVAIKWLGAA